MPESAYKSKLNCYMYACQVHHRGWTWHIHIQGSAEYFLGFEFQKSVFLWVLVKAAVLFWVVK